MNFYYYDGYIKINLSFLTEKLAISLIKKKALLYKDDIILIKPQYWFHASSVSKMLSKKYNVLIYTQKYNKSLYSNTIFSRRDLNSEYFVDNIHSVGWYDYYYLNKKFPKNIINPFYSEYRIRELYSFSNNCVTPICDVRGVNLSYNNLELVLSYTKKYLLIGIEVLYVIIYNLSENIEIFYNKVNITKLTKSQVITHALSIKSENHLITLHTRAEKDEYLVKKKIIYEETSSIIPEEYINTHI